MTWLVAVLLAGLLGVLALVLLYRGRLYWAWVVPGALALAFWWIRVRSPGTAAAVATAAFLLLAALFGLRPLRSRLVSAPLMPLFRRLLPRLGETERIALEAGTVWWDGELFSGRPDWGRLLGFPVRDLSPAERAFLEGPVEEVCRALDEWEVARLRDLPAEVWALLRRHRFFGMIIPEAYGGLGFSAAAHSAVVTKLASRSVTAAVTVMVPNSLGPAELLLAYGTDEQKRRYLPRLATGEEIPCFALTGPEAGSDAAATQSLGIVCRGRWEGSDVLGMRLTWNKRYITLGPIATVIGLAFRLQDPEHLLGDREDLGITCALVPARLPGIEIGDRHDPLGVPFQNGPTRGRDVFLPLEFIIGGRERAGEGWRMLMESLAAGRSISLPSLAVGGAKLAARVVSAYAMVREQFDTPIGRFEGVEEPLARIAGQTYLMEAARRLTVGAVDAGEHPAVLSAIAKAYLTELMRRVVNDAMDIRAGAGIVRGPRNLLARMHMAVPIGITVEGANILTRSMIIYGQGAIRCHPFVLEEIRAVEAGDRRRFDRALFGHLGFPFVCGVRSLALAILGPRLVRPPVRSALSAHFGRLSRLSAAFALVSDAAMMTLGAQLKRREKITGRLADALAWMYLASAALKRFHDDGAPERDLAFARWGLARAEAEVEGALLGVLANLPGRPLAWLLERLVFPFGARLRPEDDRLGGEVARDLLDDLEARDQLTRDIFRPGPAEPGLGRLEAALAKARVALATEAKVRAAVRAGRLDKAPGHDLADRALAAGVITEDERRRIHEADEARDEVIQVDAFDPETFRTLPP
jgi:acyl-CoA dehydrogenase